MQKLKLDKYIIVFFALIVFLLIEVFIFIPFGIKKMSSISQKTARLVKDLNQIEREWPNKDDYIKRIDELKTEVEEKRNRFALHHEESKLISFISSKSKNFDIEILSLSPGDLQDYTTTDFGEFKYLPLSIKAKGKYHNLALFLEHLQSSQYFFEVKDLDISSSKPVNKIDIIICAIVRQN